MGLFSSDDVWIHPEITNQTHELIFVTKGIVYIEEDEKNTSYPKENFFVCDRILCTADIKKAPTLVFLDTFLCKKL